jgi:hypothetical protein
LANESIESVIENCREMTTHNQELLSDVVLYIYDEDQTFNVREMASLTCATIVDDLIPFLTTHVVAKQETPHLS